MPEQNEEKKIDVWSFGLVSSTRIETLVDGVLAIAVTLLVLELSIDEHVLEAISHGNLIHGNLIAISGELMGYIFGFLVIGIYWVVHHFMFHFIKRSDGVIVWLTILFLIFAALVPLATKVNNAYEYQSQFGTLFYTLTTVISILLLLVMWIYATRGYRLVDKNLDKKTIKFVTNTIIIGTAIYLISIVGSYIISEIGYLAYVSLVYMIIATAYGDHIPFSKRR
jgi:uncharacterized membrane protein